MHLVSASFQRDRPISPHSAQRLPGRWDLLDLQDLLDPLPLGRLPGRSGLGLLPDRSSPLGLGLLPDQSGLLDLGLLPDRSGLLGLGLLPDRLGPLLSPTQSPVNCPEYHLDYPSPPDTKPLR